VKNALFKAVQWDIAMIRRETKVKSDSEAYSSTGLLLLTDEATGEAVRFRSIAVIIAVLKQLRTQKADHNIFTIGGHWKLNPMSIEEGIVEMEDLRQCVVYLDEIPERGALAFDNVLLIRNLMRCIHGVCVLSGTESSLINMIDSASGSRSALHHPWVGLLTLLPSTDLAILDSNDVLNRLSEYEKGLLQCTRPWFAQHFLELCSSRFDDSAERSSGMKYLSPEMLTSMKAWTLKVKSQLLGAVGLYGQLCLLFADSFPCGRPHKPSTDVDSELSMLSEMSLHSAGSSARTGRSARSAIIEAPSLRAADIMDHSLLIKHYFAYLTAPARQNSTSSFSLLYNSNGKLSSYDDRIFTPKAYFKTCAEDELLYMVCFRDGLKQLNGQIDSVTSSFAFTTFRKHTGFSNSNARHNSGKEFEEECVAAALLASHRYDSFSGTILKQWLEYFVAELSPDSTFNVVDIVTIPAVLCGFLCSCKVGMLSPMNMFWSEGARTNLGCTNFTWCSNGEEKDARFMSSRGNVMMEMKDRSQAFGGTKFANVIRKFADDDSVICFLIASKITDFRPSTIDQFDARVTVFKMESRTSIAEVKTAAEEHRQLSKMLVAIDLSELYSDREENVKHVSLKITT
jgi:hypothetical protein